MENILATFKKIKTVFLDVDGVITDGTVTVFENGEQVRVFSIKDGYAINRAVKEGINIIIISAGQHEGVRKRLEYLGVTEVNLGVANKVELFEKYLVELDETYESVLYMGDDMPDYGVMCKVGTPVCPSDACSDIKEISKYISPYGGGQGAVRDVLEKILKLQDKWPTSTGLSGTSN